MWKTVYPISFLSTRRPFIWLGVHFQRDLCTWCFIKQQQKDSPFKILSNQRSQAREREESSEWTSFHSFQTPKPDSWRLTGRTILSTQLYISHLYFSFLSESGEKILKLVLCILCAEGVVFAPPLDWWLINTPSCQDQLNMNHKAVDRHTSDGESVKTRLNVAFLLHVNVNV